MAAHARLSPSGSKKWFACPGSIALEAAYPNKSSVHSDRGTACHDVGARCLLTNDEAILHVGELVEVEPERMVYQLWITTTESGGSIKYLKETYDTEEQAKAAGLACVGLFDIVPYVQPARFYEFTEEMAEATQGYVDTVRALAEGQLLFVEQRVSFGDDIGVAEQFGTADTTIMYVEQKELFVIDAKFGHTPVRVERNSQLLLYALGKFRELEMAYDIERIRIGIYQPEVWDSLQEYSCTVQELMDFADLANVKAQRVVRAEESFTRIAAEDEWLEWQGMYLNPTPNDEECAFCRAMPTCPAVRRQLEETVGASFDAVEENEHVLSRPELLYVDKLAQEMRIAGLFEDRIKAVRGEVESRLLRGEPVPGFGLATGRAGARKFKNEREAEKLLKETFRLKDDIIYNKKLKSPTQLEALAKVKKAKKGQPPPPPPIIGTARWQKVVMMVEQKPPGPTVKRIEDITNPWSPMAPSDDAFGVVAEPETEELW